MKRGGTGVARLIVTKRGPEGISFATVQLQREHHEFLGSAGSLEGMAVTRPDGTMQTIAAGSIDFFIGSEACK